MCGIVGYYGNRNASPILKKGLKKLNYRGYDSWGFGFKNGERIEIIKDIGDFEQTKDFPEIDSNCGISHSRWATTGKVSKENTHPHFTEDKKIALVHNGIVENFQELKSELISKGHKFASETDTEVICHLIEEYLELGFQEAVRMAFLRLRGRNAIVVMNHDYSGLVGVKSGSPLVVGVGDNEYFIASDSQAFNSEASKVIFLEDNELVVIGD